jgi:hypothetical protein
LGLRSSKEKRAEGFQFFGEHFQATRKAPAADASGAFTSENFRA